MDDGHDCLRFFVTRSLFVASSPPSSLSFTRVDAPLLLSPFLRDDLLRLRWHEKEEERKKEAFSLARPHLLNMPEEEGGGRCGDGARVNGWTETE